MKKSLLISFSLVILSIAACNQSDAAKEGNEDSRIKQFAATKQYLDRNCISCHSEKAGEEERLAPPFYAIRKHYLKRYESEAQFVKAMSDFLQNPKQEEALMRGAVKKFGLMPALSYREGQAEEIALYLYHNDQHKPSHQAKAPNSPLAEGKKMAMATKKVLGKNLMSALQDSGKYYALAFCNERAYPLTDSMSEYLGSKIKRVSDRARNPANKASELETEILTAFRKQLETGEEMKPELRQMDSKEYTYYPILTNAMCLQCHGKLGEELEPGFYQKVQEFYPEDEAIGYGAGELRGMWVVEL